MDLSKTSEEHRLLAQAALTEIVFCCCALGIALTACFLPASGWCMHNEFDDTEIQISHPVQCSEEDTEYIFAGHTGQELSPQELLREKYQFTHAASFFAELHRGNQVQKDPTKPVMTVLPTEGRLKARETSGTYDITKTLASQSNQINQQTVKNSYPDLYSMLGDRVSVLDQGLALTQFILNGINSYIKNNKTQWSHRKKTTISQRLKMIFSSYGIQFFAPIKDLAQMNKVIEHILFAEKNQLLLILCRLDKPLEKGVIFNRNLHRYNICVQTIFTAMFSFRQYAGDVLIALLEQLALPEGNMEQKIQHHPVFFTLSALARKPETRIALMSVHDAYAHENRQAELQKRLDHVETPSCRDKVLGTVQLLSAQLKDYYENHITDESAEKIAWHMIYTTRNQRKLSSICNNQPIPDFSRDFDPALPEKQTHRFMIQEWLERLPEHQIRISDRRKFYSVVSAIEYPAVCQLVADEWIKPILDNRHVRDEVPEYLLRGLSHTVDTQRSFPGGDPGLSHTFPLSITIIQLRYAFQTDDVDDKNSPEWLYGLVDSYGKLPNNSNCQFVTNTLYRRLLVNDTSMLDFCEQKPSSNEGWEQFLHALMKGIIRQEWPVLCGDVSTAKTASTATHLPPPHINSTASQTAAKLSLDKKSPEKTAASREKTHTTISPSAPSKPSAKKETQQKSGWFPWI
ncbi:hypothetical protein CI610_00707 [invertebrate metagenome]|uniref:Uncharacterized protein n=1 Tax=invertebrate metagenome TaxID=1711999 RepID=A0A2H9TB27_9ZZZZ